MCSYFQLQIQSSLCQHKIACDLFEKKSALQCIFIYAEDIYYIHYVCRNCLDAINSVLTDQIVKLLWMKLWQDKLLK